MKRELNARQERFCELVASGKSQTDAWIKAGYNVTREVARRNAAESLTKPDIIARVAGLRARRPPPQPSPVTASAKYSGT